MLKLKAYDYSHKLNVDIVDSMQFPNGARYSDDKWKSVYLVKNENGTELPTENVKWIHANWMVGQPTKIAFLKKHGAWFI